MVWGGGLSGRLGAASLGFAGAVVCAGGLCMPICQGGHDGGLCIVVCIAFFFGVSYRCGFWLFTGPPSSLDYVSSYLFSSRI